ncbi:Calmodulin-lysine N-methyltransferase [Dirofilaria immitis]|nr:Calmodulin-lysine N-methyltransferase [Dirofilaria immitis]
MTSWSSDFSLTVLSEMGCGMRQNDLNVFIMDNIDLDKEERNGKRPVISEENLTVVSSKRPKEEEENFRKNEISKMKDITNDVEATFVVFEASFIPKYSDVGRWYHLKSPFGDIEFDVHIYSAVTITPTVLIGFNNSGNIKVWPSEECLAYYLLKHESLVQSKTILELGSGMVGLSGLTSAALGASEVVLTDGNEKSVENIRRIIEMNKLSNHVTCCVLSWNIPIPNKQFDVILCADCLFFTEEHCALLNCTYQHLKPGGIAYITAPDRNGTARTFLDLVYKERKRWQSVSVNFHIENEAEIYSKLKMQNCNIRLEIPMFLILKKMA